MWLWSKRYLLHHIFLIIIWSEEWVEMLCLFWIPLTLGAGSSCENIFDSDGRLGVRRSRVVSLKRLWLNFSSVNCEVEWRMAPSLRCEKLEILWRCFLPCLLQSDELDWWLIDVLISSMTFLHLAFWFFFCDFPTSKLLLWNRLASSAKKITLLISYGW